MILQSSTTEGTPQSAMHSTCTPPALRRLHYACDGMVSNPFSPTRENLLHSSQANVSNADASAPLIPDTLSSFDCIHRRPRLAPRTRLHGRITCMESTPAAEPLRHERSRHTSNDKLAYPRHGSTADDVRTTGPLIPDLDLDCFAPSSSTNLAPPEATLSMRRSSPGVIRALLQTR